MKLKILFLFSTILISFNLAAQCPSGNVNLTSQAEVDQFVADHPDCTKISGLLNINGSTIADLSGLEKIEEITGDLYIASTTVTSMNLSKLERIGGDMSFHINRSLKDLNIESLLTIGGDIYFHKNDDLESVDLSQLTANNGFVYFHQNSALKTINLCQITSVNGYFYMYENSVLENVCFDNLTNVNSYFFLVDSNLQNLDAFSNLSTIGQYLYIGDNSNLTSCTGLCNLLNSDGVSGDISFVNNPSACNSVSEIKNSCTVLTVNDVDQIDTSFYPNPTKGILNIGDDFLNSKFTISDISGRTIKEDILVSNILDISYLKNGIYYISTTKNKVKITQTILKN